MIGVSFAGTGACLLGAVILLGFLMYAVRRRLDWLARWNAVRGACGAEGFMEVEA